MSAVFVLFYITPHTENYCDGLLYVFIISISYFSGSDKTQFSDTNSNKIGLEVSENPKHGHIATRNTA